MSGLVRSSVLRSRALRAAYIGAAIAALFSSCSQSRTYVSNHGVLASETEVRSSAVFRMDENPVRLEIYAKIEGSGLAVELGHPDGRTTENLLIKGPGVHKLFKEYPKEPGSWELLLKAQDGDASYWYALHDRKGFQGPDEEARRLIGGQ